MKLQPITGILPIRNGAKWISTNLPKIIATLSETDELIVIDDGSEDETFGLLSQFQDERLRIQSVRAEGLVKALNLAVRLSSNDWIARFDIDDHYPIDRIQLQRNEIKEGVAAIFADYAVLNENSRNLGVIRSPVFDLPTKVSLVNSERTAHPASLFRKSVFDIVGGYLSDEFPAEDLGLWLRMSKEGKIISIPRIGLGYIKRKTSISATRKNEIQIKTRLLLDKEDFSHLASKSIKDLEETLNSYATVNFSGERLLLHMRDLCNSRIRETLNRTEKVRLLGYLFKQLASLESLSTVARLSKEKTLRFLLT